MEPKRVLKPINSTSQLGTGEQHLKKQHEDISSSDLISRGLKTEHSKENIASSSSLMTSDAAAAADAGKM